MLVMDIAIRGTFAGSFPPSKSPKLVPHTRGWDCQPMSSGHHRLGAIPTCVCIIGEDEAEAHILLYLLFPHSTNHTTSLWRPQHQAIPQTTKNLSTDFARRFSRQSGFAARGHWVSSTILQCKGMGCRNCYGYRH